MITHTGYKEELERTYAKTIYSTHEYDGPAEWMDDMLDELKNDKVLDSLNANHLFTESKSPCYHFDDVDMVTNVAWRLIKMFNEEYID